MRNLTSQTVDRPVLHVEQSEGQVTFSLGALRAGEIPWRQTVFRDVEHLQCQQVAVIPVRRLQRL